MKTNQTQPRAGTLNRRIRFNEITARQVKVHQAASLLCLALITGAATYTQAAETTYKLFGRQVGGYASKDDFPAIIKNEIGPRATMADWDALKARYGKSETDLQAFCDKIGLAPGASAWVTKGGDRFWQDQRHYFVYRADHKLPDDFMLHDQMLDNLLLLGSWYDARPLLVKVTDFNSADAAKWAKWDGMLKAADSQDISGVYTLVSVDGKILPATVSHEGATLQVWSGTFKLDPDGKCGTRTTFVPPSGTEVTVEVTATYRRDGFKLDMQWQGAGRTTGTIQSNTFTMLNEGMVFAYKK